MDKFLDLEPEFAKDAEIIENVQKKIVFKKTESLESRLSLVKLPVFKQLLEKDFFSSSELKQTYEEIVKRGSNEVEMMIFKIMSKEQVFFKDIQLKFLFYREFPGHKELFLDDSESIVFKIEDLLFRQFYLHEDSTEKIKEIIQNAPFKEKIFFSLALKGFLDAEFLKKVMFKLKDTQLLIKQQLFMTDTSFTRYWALGLYSLPKKEFYGIITSEMVYLPLVETIEIFRSVEDLVDQEELAEYLIRECFCNGLETLKFYILFLKILEILTISYESRLRFLYAWLRFFLKQKRIDLFVELLGSMNKARKKDNEFALYCEIEKYLIGECSYKRLSEITKDYRDTDEISRISISEILQMYKR